MKPNRASLLTLAVIFSCAVIGFSQHGANPRGKDKLTVNGQTITIEYGRPSLKGRTFEELLKMPWEPGHGFWRLGADKSTTFTTTANLKFGAATVHKGIYSLLAQRTANNQWKLVFNTDHGQWGTKHNPAHDVAFVPLKETKVSESAQELVISITKHGNGGVILIHWGDTELTTHFTVA